MAVEPSTIDLRNRDKAAKPGDARLIPQEISSQLVSEPAEVAESISECETIIKTVNVKPSKTPKVAPEKVADAKLEGLHEQLGSYRIIKKIGEGAMGAVYLATDVLLDRKVAIKVIKPDLASSSMARERFLREVRSMAAVNHEHIATIYAADEESNGTTWLAMEFLQGTTLEGYLRSGKPLKYGHIMRIGREIARGLHAAHQKGFIHRDIKPANIWLEAPQGKVKLLDFGLARQVEAGVEITGSNVLVGTPAFMAPEQATNEPTLDHRCDLFSLGALLYRVITGTYPFKGETLISLLSSLAISTPEKILDLKPDCPPGLADLVHRLLEKDPADRPATARAVAEELHEIERGGMRVNTKSPQQSQDAPLDPSCDAMPMIIEPHVQLSTPWAGIVEPSTVVATKNLDSTIWMRGKRTKRLRVAIGLVLITMLSVGSVYLKKSRNPVSIPEETATVVTPTKSEEAKGKSLKKPTEVAKEKAIESKIENAAQTAISLGGWVTVLNGAQDVDIKNLDLLPGDPSSIHGLWLSDSKIKDKDVSKFQELNNLRRLWLCRTDVTDAGIQHLQPMKKLEEVYLENAKITDGGLIHLQNAIKLNKLSLLDTTVGNAGIAHLRELPSLSWLGLQGTQVTDDGLPHLKTMPSLNVIFLDRTQVSDSGMKSIGELKSLQSLSVSSTPVSDIGIAHLRNHAFLTELWAGNTSLSDAALEVLAKMPSLTYLNLKGTKVTATGIAKFHNAVPTCKVLWDGGTVQAEQMIDPDRKVAQQVLKAGGVPTIFMNGRHVEIYDLSELPSQAFFVTRIDFTLQGQPTDDLLAGFSGCVELEYLGLRGSSITDAGLVFLSECDNINNLDLEGCAISNEGLSSLANLKELQRLNLSHTKISDDGLLALGAKPNLMYLQLEATNVTDAGLLYLKQFPNLRILRLRDTKLSEKGLLNLADCKELIHLNLMGMKVSEIAVKRLAKSLLRSRIDWDQDSLRPSSAFEPDRNAAEWVLSMGGMIEIDDRRKPIKSVDELPDEPFRLTMMSLRNLKVRDRELACLSECTNLVGIDLYKCNLITDVGLGYFKNSKGLQILGIGGTQATDHGLSYFRDCKNLTDVMLNDTKVSSVGLRYLTDLKNLTMLHVSNTKVTLIPIQDFAKSRPKCRIIHNGGTFEPKK
jgi:eukaryotic-like serine/threonine-protein kinase